jgi:hypothetical protein
VFFYVRGVSDLNNMLDRTLVGDGSGDASDSKANRNRRLGNKQAERSSKKKKITRYEPGLEMLRLKARGFVFGKIGTLSAAPSSNGRLDPQPASESSEPQDVSKSGAKRKVTTVSNSEKPSKRMGKSDKGSKKSTEKSELNAPKIRKEVDDIREVNKSDESSGSDDDGPEVKTPLKRNCQPSTKVVENVKLALETAAEKAKKEKEESKVTKNLRQRSNGSHRESFRSKPLQSLCAHLVLAVTRGEYMLCSDTQEGQVAFELADKRRLSEIRSSCICWHVQHCTNSCRLPIHLGLSVCRRLLQPD